MSIAQPLSRVDDALEHRGGARASRRTMWSMLQQGLLLALPRTGWALLSIGLFAGLWELLWAIGVADPRLLPPPHIFLGNFPEQLKSGRACDLEGSAVQRIAFGECKCVKASQTFAEHLTLRFTCHVSARPLFLD